ncbi:MAG: 2,3-bisphosphoglycerate-independent phosphoglycerate mutase [Pseudomonadota bacterium]
MSTIEHLPRKPVILIILDGFGANPSKKNNAVALARTPKLDKYFSTNTHTTLAASGSASGLPDGQMGNSEVGHITLGCGDIVRQNLVIINETIADASFCKNPVLTEAIEKSIEKKKPIHILGLVSDGGVHSHINHLLALINMIHQHNGIPNLHMITDGRDCAPRSAKKFLSIVEPALAAAGGKISTIMGRFYAMDRDHRWERIEKAWKCLVNGEGRKLSNAFEAIQLSYDKGEDDEFITPTFLEGGEVIKKGEQLICLNFRKDRPRQIVSSLFKKQFDEFDRGNFKPAEVTCFTEYDEWFQLPYAFELDRPKTTLAATISKAGIKQFHCAETEKYAHVTFFFNGGRGEPFPGEERCLIDSPKVETYDLMPEMSAAKVADKVIDAIKRNQYGFIVVNFANGDMVGHTAKQKAVIKAVETLDKEVGRVIKTARKSDFSVILTADHGNCDEMVDPVTGDPHTQHTVYPVPCLIIDDLYWQLSSEGGLKNVAPTVLHLMGLSKPDRMPAKSLLLGPYN